MNGILSLCLKSYSGFRLYWEWNACKRLCYLVCTYPSILPAPLTNLPCCSLNPASPFLLRTRSFLSQDPLGWLLHGIHVSARLPFSERTFQTMLYEIVILSHHSIPLPNFNFLYSPKHFRNSVIYLSDSYLLPLPLKCEIPKAIGFITLIYSG